VNQEIKFSEEIIWGKSLLKKLTAGCEFVKKECPGSSGSGSGGGGGGGPCVSSSKITGSSFSEIKTNGNVTTSIKFSCVPKTTPTPCGCYYYDAHVSISDITSATDNTDPTKNGLVLFEYKDCENNLAIKSFNSAGLYANGLCQKEPPPPEVSGGCASIPAAPGAKTIKISNCSSGEGGGGGGGNVGGGCFKLCVNGETYTVVQPAPEPTPSSSPNPSPTSTNPIVAQTATPTTTPTMTPTPTQTTTPTPTTQPMKIYYYYKDTKKEGSSYLVKKLCCE